MSITTQTIDLSIIEKMERYTQNLKEFQALFEAQQKFIEGGDDLYKNLNQLISSYNKYLEFENAFLNNPIALKLKTIGKYVETSVSVITPLMTLWPIYVMTFILYKVFERLEIPKLFDKAQKNSQKIINKIISNIKNGKSLFESNQKLFAFNKNGHNFPGISLEKININHRNVDRKPINSLCAPVNDQFKFNDDNYSSLLETLGFSLLVQGDSGTGKTHLVETQIPKYYDSSVLLSVNTKSLINVVSSEPGIIHRVLDTFTPVQALLKPSNSQISENFLRNIDMFGKFLEKLNNEVLKLEKQQRDSKKIAIIVNFDEFEKFLDDESVVNNISSDDLMKLFKFFDRFSNFQSESQYCEGKKSRIIISMTSNKKLEDTMLFKKFAQKNQEQQNMQDYLNTRLQGHKFEFQNQSFIEIIKFIREKCFEVNENNGDKKYDFDKEISLFLEKSILKALAAIKQDNTKQDILTANERKIFEKNKNLFIIIYKFLFDDQKIDDNFNYQDENLRQNIESKITETFSDTNKAQNIKKLLEIQDDKKIFCMRDFNIAIDEIKDKLYPKPKIELTFIQKVLALIGLK